ncbi:M20/M25/M40 family metallo-hydrolase [Novosphingobium sp.]|uniref:M20/M25/M40 family metallo-hydrolase n=1 Tax=Novosphingobium sp. TaxID=1874826 RepID=UPI00273758D7|nr:M20/M25/M40 family metallo-hydrolase [Novosphingobium sp.]MDP3907109.1 M20/M25/M40 family metallo-hydrolase [Novosphingobium sp.]
MNKGFGMVAVLLAAVVLAIMATTPPMPQGPQTPPTEFAVARAMPDVVAIAREPHITGTPENARVRDYIAERMQTLGMDVSTSTGTVGERGTAKRNRWTGRDDPPATLTNVIGVLPGRNRALPAVLLMSHHDTVWGSPGAADDTAGIAVSLEVVRAIRAGGGAERDLVVLVTDAEELGLEGAKHFFAQHPLRTRVGAVINMEARGGGGRTTLFQTSKNNGNAAALFADVVQRPGGSSLAAYIYSVLPNDTDLTPVLAGPYTAYNFAFIGRSGLYHSPLATPARLDQGAVQDMGTQVLDLTRALLSAQSMPAPAPDAVFFDLFGRIMLTYPAWAGWAMLVLAVGALGWTARTTPDLRALGGGAGRMAGLLLLSGAVFYVLNVLSGADGPTDYYDRLAAIPRLEAIAALAGAAAALVLFGGGALTTAGKVGAALPLLLIAAAGQAIAPTAAYFMVVPVMLAALALLSLERSRGTAARLFAGAAAAAVLGYMLALGHQLMQGVGPTMPMAAALPLALAALGLLPVWPGLTTRTARVAAAALLVAAIGVALWVRLDPVAESVAVYADTKR